MKEGAKNRKKVRWMGWGVVVKAKSLKRQTQQNSFSWLGSVYQITICGSRFLHVIEIIKT